MKWISREHVKVDRVACPWLIRNYIDPEAEFLFVPAADVAVVAEREGATPFRCRGCGARSSGPLYDALHAISARQS